MRVIYTDTASFCYYFVIYLCTCMFIANDW